MISKYSARNPFGTARQLALALLLGFLSSHAVGVSAQTISPLKGEYVAPPELSQAFVVYQTPGGDTVCRDASPAEARELNRGSGVPLRQINHLKDGSDQAYGNSNVNAVSAGLTIVLRATAQLDANPAAKQAFINAAARWEALIADPITVTIDVDYGSTAFGTPFSSPNVLGVTSSSAFLIPYTTVRSRLVSRAAPGSEEAVVMNNLPALALPTDVGSVSTIFVPPSLMSALGLSVTNPPVPRIGFNSAFGFDFDPNDGVTSALTDFDAVAVHEIGHALGFTSEGGGRDLDPTRQLLASIWDIYRFKPGAASNANFATATRSLSVGADAGDRRVQFNGNSEIDLSTGKPDATGGDGRQSSHWRDDALGVPYIGIMDPTITRGVHKQITANDLRALDFFGYSVGQVFVPPPPANDNFANARQLTGTSGRVTGTNVGATKEANEPSHSPDGNAGGKSVWYVWQSPSSGTATLTTGAGSLGGGSDYDTLLAVYIGSGVGSLATVARNDDQSQSDQSSAVTFNAVAGTTYRIAVDGFSADAGNIALSWNVVVAPPAGTTVQFASATTSVIESGGNAPIAITRGGSLSSTSSVVVRTIDDARAIRCDDIASAPSAAFARCDYVTTVQTVTFAPGETTKIVNVPLVDDSFGEPVETVTLTLGGTAVGATVGAQGTTTLSIISNEAPGQTGANPIFDATFFVRMQYLDFLSREPDAGGLAAWVSTLNNCAPGDTRCDRASVSSGFFRSQEFEQKGRFVFNFYKVSFGRLPRYSEIVADMSNVTGVSTAEVVARKAVFTDAWAQRLDFLGAFGGMTNSQLVNALLDRYALPSITTPNPATPDDSSQKVSLTRADLVGRLDAGTLTRAQLVRAVAGSDEVGRAEFNSAFVAMQYFGYLRRDPDAGGYADWLRTINANPNDIHSMVNGFVSSDEYKLRFGPQ